MFRIFFSKMLPPLIGIVSATGSRDFYFANANNIAHYAINYRSGLDKYNEKLYDIIFSCNGTLSNFIQANFTSLFSLSGLTVSRNINDAADLPIENCITHAISNMLTPDKDLPNHLIAIAIGGSIAVPFLFAVCIFLVSKFNHRHSSTPGNVENGQANIPLLNDVDDEKKSQNLKSFRFFQPKESVLEIIKKMNEELNPLEEAEEKNPDFLLTQHAEEQGLICPITLSVMRYPVKADDGIFYDYLAAACLIKNKPPRGVTGKDITQFALHKPKLEVLKQFIEAEKKILASPTQKKLSK